MAVTSFAKIQPWEDTMSKYTVTNVYEISGESNHRTPEAAIRAARKREGEGWIVVDQDGNQWDSNGDQAVIVTWLWTRFTRPCTRYY